MKNSFIRIALILVVSYLLFCAYLFVNQRSYIYFPRPGLQNEWSVITDGVSVFELNNQGITLRGWALNKDRHQAIIYFGGNAERVEANIPEFRKTFSGHSVYLAPYRGYGGIEGTATEENLYSDALAIYDEVAKRHAEIFIIGRSLGSGVATYLASVRKVDKLILVTPFDSMVNLAREFYPLFPVGLFLIDQYDSASRVGQLESQTLVMVAGKDEIVPRQNTERLLSAFKPDHLTVKGIDQATHNSISTYPEYLKTLADFLKSPVK